MSVRAPEAKYMSEPRLLKRFDEVGRAMAFRAKTPAQAKAWRQRLTRKLRELTGYDTFRAAPLKPKVTGEERFDDFIRQRVEIQTEPGVIMPLYVIIPRAGKGPFPAVIAPHGHGSGGKYSPAGRRDIPEIAGAIEKYNYDYGLQYARAGLIAFCPDARGFGERQERLSKDALLKSSCQWLNNMGFPLGQTVTGMWAWELGRVIDYIGTRRDCIPGRVGCGGLSGGGLQTLWAAALDPRIECAVVSGYMYGYRESLGILHGNCSCNYVPHLYEYADMGDVGALIAPRPLLVETGDRDPLNGPSGLKNVLPQTRIIRRAYKALGHADRFQHVIFSGEHKWHGVEAVPWMQRWLTAPRA